jgi:hypothetical protein
MKRKQWIVWSIASLVALLVAVVIALSTQPAPTSYKFVTVDHPVDMWQDGGDTWAYFSLGEGSTFDVSEKARQELLPQGFVEDTTRAPWYRFTNGREEVIVCNHHEFAVESYPGGSKIVPGRATLHPGSRPWPCVLVKNGAGTEMPLPTFKIKKLVHGW